MEVKPNPVTHCTFIIRSQIEYSTMARAVIMRCILEAPATGQHRGFTDVEDLLATLRAELMEMQNDIIPPSKER